jgi:carbonic anhydrase
MGNFDAYQSIPCGQAYRAPCVGLLPRRYRRRLTRASGSSLFLAQPHPPVAALSSLPAIAQRALVQATIASHTIPVVEHRQIRNRRTSMNSNSFVALPIALVTLAVLSGLAQAAEKAAPKPGAAPDPIVAAIRHLTEANESFVKSHGPDFFAPLIPGQRPKVTVLMCSDSRVHSHAIDQDPDGDLFMVREIGNQMVSGEGSVEYGVRHLHTPLLVIIGHSSCGAVKAAMGDYSSIEPAIKRELDAIKVTGKNADDPKEVQESVATNVHNQVAYARKTFAPEIKDGKLAVVGAVYDFRNDYKQGYGRLVIINVNGETDPEKIKRHRLFADN